MCVNIRECMFILVHICTIYINMVSLAISDIANFHYRKGNRY